MSAPLHWQEATHALSAQDPIMAAIIASYEGEAMQLRGDAFYTLARSIAGQQISVKAADSVWNRVQDAVGDVNPTAIANTDSSSLRACGLSTRKVLYMHALAEFFLVNAEQIKAWPHCSDEQIIKELTTIKGIGRWTAEMFLIFGLGRPDVFPVDDLGLLKGIYRHYNSSEKLPLADVIAIGETWRPWRSVGTWYMWRVLDPVPVEY